MSSWTRLTLERRALLKVPGPLYEWFDNFKICVEEVSLHFKLEMNILEILSLFTDENLRIEGVKN